MIMTALLGRIITRVNKKNQNKTRMKEGICNKYCLNNKNKMYVFKRLSFPDID